MLMYRTKTDLPLKQNLVRWMSHHPRRTANSTWMTVSMEIFSCVPFQHPEISAEPRSDLESIEGDDGDENYELPDMRDATEELADNSEDLEPTDRDD